jgi:cytochrome b561
MTVHLHPNTLPISGYHPVTRWLHAGLVLGVVFQLLCASLMAHPDHDEAGHGGAAMAQTETVTAQAELLMSTVSPPVPQQDAWEQWLMAAHRNGGIFVALIVLANLLWAVMPRGKPRKRQLAVLVSVSHWSETIVIGRRLPQMLTGKRPLPEPGNSLSLIVEMFGLLTMTAMAISGSIVWNMWAGPGSKVSEMAEFWMEIHAGIAVLLFLYLAGHVSMALMHARAGDSVFVRILPWGSK